MSPLSLLSALGALELQATVTRNRYAHGSTLWNYNDGRVFAYKHAAEAVRALLAADKPQPKPEVAR